MGLGASFTLVSPRPPQHGREGLLHFGTTEALAAWAWAPLRLGIIEAPAAWAWVWGPPSLWIHRGPRCMGMGASFALGPPRLPPHGHGRLSA